MVVDRPQVAAPGHPEGDGSADASWSFMNSAARVGSMSTHDPPAGGVTVSDMSSPPRTGTKTRVFDALRSHVTCMFQLSTAHGA